MHDAVLLKRPRDYVKCEFFKVKKQKLMPIHLSFHVGQCRIPTL